MTRFAHRAPSALASFLAIGLAAAAVVRADASGEIAAAPVEREQVAPMAAAPEPSPRVTRLGFVDTEGTRFVLDGQPFHFLGANVAVVHGQTHRGAMERTLDAVRADGLRVVRLWALGEREDGSPEWSRDYAFRVGEEGWVETSFSHLDRALVAARERDLKVIVVLANRWRDYGGIPQYMRWAGVPFDEAAPYGPSEIELLGFLGSARCDALYQAHVRRVVERVNAISGVAYRDDPTIFAWELINEISAPPRASAALTAWVARSAAFVRSLDPDHLIGAGHVGYERSSERGAWLAVQRLPEIDYADAHAYPAAYDRVRDADELARYVDDRVQLAHHVARKPFVWGEFGFGTRTQRVLGRARASWVDTFLDASHRDGVGGALVWTYVPSADRPSDFGIHPDGDGARRTRDLRSVLARHAARWARVPPRPANERLGDAFGEEPRFVRERTVRGTSRVHDGWRDDALAFDVRGFRRARFEGVGTYLADGITQLWGSGRGLVEYRFRGPRGATPTELRLSARLSSELPGAGVGATADDGARLRVRLDGEEIGVIDAPADDGVGAHVELVSNDAELLARLFASPRATHVLSLEVVPGFGAEGLCLYDVEPITLRVVR